MKLEVELLRGRTNSLLLREYRIGFWTEQQLPQKDSQQANPIVRFKLDTQKKLYKNTTCHEHSVHPIHYLRMIFKP